MNAHTALTNYIRFISFKTLFYEFLNEKIKKKRGKIQKAINFFLLHFFFRVLS